VSQFLVKRHKSEYMYFVWNTPISNVLSAVLDILLALVLMEILSRDNYNSFLFISLSA
jgi:hypothetical protein